MQSSSFKRLAFFPILAVGVVGMAFSVVKTGRDALFFRASSVSDLPLVYLYTELGLLVGALLHLFVMRRLGSRRSRVGLTLGSGLVLALFGAFVARAQWAPAALFSVTPALFAALFSSTWLLAGDLLEGADDESIRWAYSAIAASAMVGGMIGSLMAGSLSTIAPPAVLVATGAMLTFIVWAICGRAHRAVQRDSMEPSPPRKTGAPAAEQGRTALRALGSQPYVQALFAISALGTLVGLYVEFRFYAFASASGYAHARFFATYYFLLSFVSLLLTLAVGPRIQARLGIGMVLMALPAGIFGAAVLTALVTTMVAQIVLRVVETGLKNSIHRASWEQAFLVLRRADRGHVKVLVDGAIPRVAGLLGAGILYLLVRGTTPTRALAASAWVPFALMFFAAVWVLFTRRLRSLGGVAATTEHDPRVRVPDT